MPTTRTHSACILLAALWLSASLVAAQTPRPESTKGSDEREPAPAPTTYAYVLQSTSTAPKAEGHGNASGSSDQGSMVWVGPDGKHFTVHSAQGRRAYLGIGLLEITSGLREHFGAPSSAGVLISEIAAKSPAANSGLQVGDVLTAIDGEPVESKWDAVQRIADHAKGDTVELRVYRDGRPLTLRATLSETTRPSFDMAPFLLRSGHDGDLRVRVEAPDVHVDVPDAPTPERVIEIRKEALDKAMKELNEKLESPEFRQRLQEAQERSLEIEKRTGELESRLRAMQKEIEEKQKLQSRELQEQLRQQSAELERKQQQIDRLQQELDSMKQQ